MRWLLLPLLTVFLTTVLCAHHPDRESHRVHPYYDLIGPLGSHLPPSHRRKYNRPSNIGGKIAYYIAPSSQEAMAWHKAQHRGYYKNHRPRMVTHFFYPKPWEAMKVGPRIPTSPEAAAARSAGGYGARRGGGMGNTEMPEGEGVLDQETADAAVPANVGEPIVDDPNLIEQ